MLVTDALVKGFLSREAQIDATATDALDFLLNLAQNKDLYALINSPLLTQEFLEKLIMAIQECEFEEKSREKLIIGKIKQVITENFGQDAVKNPFDEPLI